MYVSKGKSMEPRWCPNCDEEIPIDHGFSFDEKGNVICEKCGKIILKLEEDSFFTSTEE